MGKFGALVPTNGRYVNAADKAALAENAVALQIVAASHEPRATFGPRWLIDAAILATGETVAIDFASANAAGEPIVSRMLMFGELAARLAEGERFDPVILVRVSPVGGGNSYWTFRDATDAEIANSRDQHSGFVLDDDGPAEPVAKPKLRKAVVDGPGHRGKGPGDDDADLPF